MEVDYRPLSDLREEYWMIQKLGCGGFGKVYLIRHRKSREYSAAKHQRWHNQDVPRLTRREVTVLRKLVHKQNDHVLQYIDYFEGERQSVILAEFLGGGELFQRISSSDYNLTEAKCRDFARQILRAVEFIHSRGIVHLDLKPQNIVLVEKLGSPNSAITNDKQDLNERRNSPPNDNSGSYTSHQKSKSSPNSERLKIIDFGLARDLGGADFIPINMCGTLEFMSPEVMKCSHASFASDMWSVGVILYMMVSGGISPFWAGNEYRTQRLILRGHLANHGFSQGNFKDVSQSAIECISNLLLVDTRTRYTTSDCLESKWLTTAYLDTLKNLETVWIRKYLARRRWQRWYNTIRAMNRMIHMGLDDSGSRSENGNVAKETRELLSAKRTELMSDSQEMGMVHYTSSHLDERWV